MVFCGVILGPRQRLGNRGRCRGHHPESPGGRTAGGWKFQYRPGRTRGMGEGQEYLSSNGVGETGGHERPLPPTAQAVVE